jgi:UDP-N-acetylmuramate--alanine ligase
VILRGALLAELMASRQGVAVAGAHGKTTTTAMLGLVLDRAGLDPTVVIGGRFAAFGSHARVGQSALLIAEADESDRSFLWLRPHVAIVTNIDREHLESYGTFDDLKGAFRRFADSVPNDGAAILCVDDPHVKVLAKTIAAPVVSYGIDNGRATIGVTDVTIVGYGSMATVVHRAADGRDSVLGTLALQVPGPHNILNALAVVAAATRLGVSFAAIAAALVEFRGAERRFERKGESSGRVLVDDYGHHPTEIAAVLRAARATGVRRILCVFQPHRYSRTAQLLHDFGPALALADEIVLTDIYPAGEDPIPGVTIDALADEIRKTVAGPVHVIARLDDVPTAVARWSRPGDMVITLGAGSIGAIGDRILEEIRACR